jgi:hypothetical protein
MCHHGVSKPAGRDVFVMTSRLLATSHHTSHITGLIETVIVGIGNTAALPTHDCLVTCMCGMVQPQLSPHHRHTYLTGVQP